MLIPVMFNVLMESCMVSCGWCRCCEWSWQKILLKRAFWGRYSRVVLPKHRHYCLAIGEIARARRKGGRRRRKATRLVTGFNSIKSINSAPNYARKIKMFVIEKWIENTWRRVTSRRCDVNTDVLLENWGNSYLHRCAEQCRTVINCAELWWTKQYALLLSLWLWRMEEFSGDIIMVNKYHL